MRFSCELKGSPHSKLVKLLCHRYRELALGNAVIVRFLPVSRVTLGHTGAFQSLVVP